MHEPVEQFEVAGATVKIYPDYDPMNPRENDNLCEIVTWHRRYELGDKQINLDDVREIGRRASKETLIRFLKIHWNAAFVIPLGLLDHSGLCMYVGDGTHPMDGGGWDSGTVGFAYVTREKIIAEYGAYNKKTHKKAYECAMAELDEYCKFIEGDVYGYVIEYGEEEESVWGFIGFDYVKKEARAAAKFFVKATKDEEKKIAQVMAL